MASVLANDILAQAHPALRPPEPQNGRPDVRLDTSLELLTQATSAEPAEKAVATLVSTAGSTYRKPGARMVIRSDGSFLGLLSGGCLEADLHAHAQTVLAGGAASAVEYDMRGPDDVLFGMGAGCEGAMRILLESVSDGSLAAMSLAAAGRETRSGRATCLIVIHESCDLPLGTYGITATLPGGLIAAAQQALADGRSRAFDGEISGKRTRALVQYLAPPPHLLICGAGPDALPVVNAATALGWRVSIVDHRPGYAVAERFPRALVVRADPRDLSRVLAIEQCHAAVVMSHHLQSDVTYLTELAQAGAPGFVGLLGPAARRQRIFSEMGSAAERLESRLRGPVGIDIGAATPEGIALSIVSQIHGWLAGRDSS